VDTPCTRRAGDRGRRAQGLLSALRITDVAGWQRSHSLSADSVIGPRTQRALVLAFQNAHGLVVDGVVGPRTLDALGL
jgi:murein L,D-transpeptidase YcbB/YkuD